MAAFEVEVELAQNWDADDRALYMRYVEYEMG